MSSETDYDKYVKYKAKYLSLKDSMNAGYYPFPEIRKYNEDLFPKDKRTEKEDILMTIVADLQGEINSLENKLDCCITDMTKIQEMHRTDIYSAYIEKIISIAKNYKAELSNIKPKFLPTKKMNIRYYKPGKGNIHYKDVVEYKGENFWSENGPFYTIYVPVIKHILEKSRNTLQEILNYMIEKGIYYVHIPPHMNKNYIPKVEVKVPKEGIDTTTKIDIKGINDPEKIREKLLANYETKTYGIFDKEGLKCDMDYAVPDCLLEIIEYIRRYIVVTIGELSKNADILSKHPITNELSSDLNKYNDEIQKLQKQIRENRLGPGKKTKMEQKGLVDPVGQAKKSIFSRSMRK